MNKRNKKARVGIEPTFQGYEPRVIPIHLPAIKVGYFLLKYKKYLKKY